jgi:hypothetical protein
MLAVAQHIHDLYDQLQRTLGRLARITDSTKKRSRNLLHTLKDSQDSLEKLERYLIDDASFEQRQIALQRVEGKVDLLLKHLSITEN